MSTIFWPNLFSNLEHRANVTHVYHLESPAYQTCLAFWLSYRPNIYIPFLTLANQTYFILFGQRKKQTFWTSVQTKTLATLYFTPKQAKLLGWTHCSKILTKSSKFKFKLKAFPELSLELFSAITYLVALYNHLLRKSLFWIYIIYQNIWKLHCYSSPVVCV